MRRDRKKVQVPKLRVNFEVQIERIRERFDSPTCVPHLVRDRWRSRQSDFGV